MVSLRNRVEQGFEDFAHFVYRNDTLKLTFLANTFGPTGDDGAFRRFSAEYDYTDSIQLTGGIVFYQSGDPRRTMGIGDNDRVYLDLQYSF